MNEHSFRVLEYDKFLGLLAGYTCTEPGGARIRALRPRTDDGEDAVHSRLCADCLELRNNGVELPPPRFESPEELLMRVAPDRAVLEAEGFLAIRQLLRTVDTVGHFTRRDACAGAGEVRELGRRLDDCEGLCRGIDRTFDKETGEVLDHASDRLRQIRNKINAMEDRIRARLESALSDPAFGEVLQDTYVTRRHGRYVVPIRREARGDFKGIVHDQSNSGRTLFVEPEDAVEQGNELEELRLGERDEIRRILAALSGLLREHADEIRDDYELLCRYDVAFAVSGWARRAWCTFPELGDRLRLIEARHPLLHHQFMQEEREDDLVPLDLDMPPDKSVVVITGSNTGGKTVTLKTIGLLTMIAQTGLPVPAGPGTCIRCFQSIVADIGDEQSIEQSLSTFSGHLQQIVAILREGPATAALVLLDELGAGTDPVEGGALGCASLEELAEAAGITFATTHLGAVKTFVHGHPKMENASMAFNVETLGPEFRLLMGRAGASYALTIAERSGVAGDVLARARGLMDADEVKLEEMLTSLDREHARLKSELDSVRRSRDEAESASERAQSNRDRITRELEALRKERRKLLHQAQEEAAALVANARREVDAVLARTRSDPERERAGRERRKLEERSKRLNQGMEETRDRPEEPMRKEDLAVGSRVWVEAVKDHGRVTAISGDGGRVTVDVDGLTFEVKARELGRPKAPETKARRAPAPAVKGGAPRESSMELNLVGRRVEEARKELDRFIDSALLSDLPLVRIVHGHGTGALRKAVHEYLDGASVEGYRLGKDGEDMGGSGVTLVTL